MTSIYLIFAFKISQFDDTTTRKEIFVKSKFLRNSNYNNKTFVSVFQTNITLSTPNINYFTCFDNSNSFAVLDDDYCDCLDGSDEPDTSACSIYTFRKKTFRCKNLDYPYELYGSRVNDGVCDCSDGSDENLGKIDCEAFFANKHSYHIMSFLKSSSNIRKHRRIL